MLRQVSLYGAAMGGELHRGLDAFVFWRHRQGVPLEWCFFAMLSLVQITWYDATLRCCGPHWYVLWVVRRMF